MDKSDFTRIDLAAGWMDVYEFGETRLHAYRTADPIDDEAFVVEKGGRGFVIEPPCFFDSIAALEGYIRNAGIDIAGIVASYHMAGASFFAGAPVFATREADEYGHSGGGRALIDGFSETFGDAFDGSILEVTDFIEGEELELAGVRMRIVRTSEAFDLEIPEIDAVYTHMLGHDCHSIVAGPAHADAVIAQLRGYFDRGIGLVLTSHYTPEDLKDVQAKIDYLEDLKSIARRSDGSEDFKAAVQGRYPDYSGGNYLDMTAKLFFA